MFHVLVLGGLTLVGCGGSTAAASDKGGGDAEPSDATSTEDGFPSETPFPALDADGLPESSDTSTAPAMPGSRASFRRHRHSRPTRKVSDAGTSDASEYADARIQDAGQCVPCEVK